MTICKPSPFNSRDQFIALVDAAILEGRAVQIDLSKSPASHFVYLRKLYAAGKIDRCSDEWMGVLTFASPEVAHR
jgi:hypothetical protein